MSYSLFAIYEASGSQAPVIADALRAAMSVCPVGLSKHMTADLFLPEPEPVVLFDDGPAPAAILQVSVSTRASLEEVADNAWFRNSFLNVPAAFDSVSFGAFLVRPSPVAGGDAALSRSAGLSFVVRYYGPMLDEDAFVDFYTANHPPILARLPKIRNVFCYLPQPLPKRDLPPAEVRFINEVVFDDVRNLNAALQSEVIADLKADSARFPPYGHSTHHAMRRERLLTQEVE